MTDFFGAIGDIFDKIVQTAKDIVNFIPKIFQMIENFMGFIPTEIYVILSAALVMISAVFIYRFIR